LKVPLPRLGLGGERKLAAEQLVVGISRDELLQGQKILRVRKRNLNGRGRDVRSETNTLS
jgi:hypothetical protein